MSDVAPRLITLLGAGMVLYGIMLAFNLPPATVLPAMFVLGFTWDGIYNYVRDRIL